MEEAAERDSGCGWEENVKAIRERQLWAFVLKGRRTADKGLMVRQSPKEERYWRAEVWQCSWTDFNILIHLKEREFISALASVFLEDGQGMLVYSSEQQTSCGSQWFSHRCGSTK